MNKRLVYAILWVVASVLAAFNMTGNDLSFIWSLATILFAWNAIKQFRLYQEEKDND